jgi:myosin-1
LHVSDRRLCATPLFSATNLIVLCCSSRADIFYQLCRGAPAAAVEKYSLGNGLSDFVYLSASGSPDVPGIDDVEEFEATRTALKATGFGSKEQDAIFSLIAAVLHLGNLKFKEDEKTGSCRISSTATAAEMLGIEPDQLKRLITVRHIKTAKEEYDVPNNAVQCVQARDAIAKSLYFRLFDWIVKRVNQAIANEDAQTEHSIGVLDIYGFEVFAVNGFEQFWSVSGGAARVGEISVEMLICAILSSSPPIL